MAGAPARLPSRRAPLRRAAGEDACPTKAGGLARGGTGVAIMQEPPRVGFQAKVKIEAAEYIVRITAVCRPAPKERRIGRSSWPTETTAAWRAQFAEQEQRRVWRVLFYYLKNAFECADSGVVELREVLLPHIVVGDGRTIGEHILPRLADAVQTDPARLLGSGGLR